MKSISSLRLGNLFFRVIIFSVIATSHFSVDAQDYSISNVPVLSPDPDINGVDMPTGTYLVKAPFEFNVPEAGHLNASLIYNGRKYTTSINVYLEDQTLTRPDWGDASNRQIRIHFGGEDRVFICAGIGDCTQVSKINGDSLKRVGETTYAFADREGVRVSFFPMSTQTLHPTVCVDAETGCNAAGYFGYAYASSILYPTGEKLTFANFNTAQDGKYYLTVSSNLGFSLDIVSSCPAACSVDTSYPGAIWLQERYGLYNKSYRLRKGSEIIRQVSFSYTSTAAVSWPPKAGEVAYNRYVTITDDMSRAFKVNYLAKWTTNCNAVLDGTNFLPIKITSPEGRVIDVGYYDVPPGQSILLLDAPPVTSVTRNGKTWAYDYGYISIMGGQNQLMETDPTGRTRKKADLRYPIPWDVSWGANQNSFQCIGNFGSDILSDTDGLNRKTEYTYSSQGVLASVSKPGLNGSVVEHDARGNVKKVTESPRPQSNFLPRVTYEASYDVVCDNVLTCNKPNWTKDALGAQTNYEYDPTHGGVTKITLPAALNGIRPQRRITYEAVAVAGGTIYRIKSESECADSSVCSGTASELLKQFTYTGSSLLKSSVKISRGDGQLPQMTSFFYDIRGLLTKQIDPLGRDTYFFYDTAGRLTGKILPDPDGSGALQRPATRTTYNKDDQPTKVETGTVSAASGPGLAAMSVMNTVKSTYDPSGQIIKEVSSGISGDNGVRQFSYDGAGRAVCTAIRMDPDQWNGQSDVCVPQLSGPNGPDRITKNEYDAAGQLVQVRRGVGTPLEQAYTTYTYTSNGKQEYVIDANGNRAQMVYDGFDRLSRWIFPSKTGPVTYAPGSQAGALAQAGSLNTADYEEYTYDANGNRKSHRKRDGSTLSYDYDALNRMIRKIVPNRAGLPSSATRDVYYTYDLQGHQTDARFDTATGEGIHSVFDGLGREKSHRLTMDGVSREVLYEYDGNNNRTRVTQPDGAYARYEYDGLDRLKQAWWGWTNVSGELSFSEITYKPNGLREALTHGSSTTSYSYDNALRLSNLKLDLNGTANDLTETFTYNPASQITEATSSNNAYAYRARLNVNRPYSVNGLNQYTSINGRFFCYDANGNLTADGTYVYLYDVENRLIEKRAQTNTDCGALAYTGAVQATLRYDPMGRLYETVGNVTGTTRMAYDGDRLIAEYNAVGNLQRRYLWGDRVDEPLAWDEGGLLDCSSTRFLVGNHQGSIIATADCNGNLTRSFSYDEYGMPQAAGGAPLTPMTGARFLYTGQTYQPDLGMYFYKARMYSPTLGRFMQTDPVGYDDQINLYAYVGNDPVNKSDPSGKEQQACPTSADPQCARRAEVEAPLTKAEQEKNREIGGEARKGESTVGERLANEISDLSPIEALSNANTMRQIGAAGEASALKELNENGFNVVESQLYVKSAGGMRIVDFVVKKDGEIVFVEVKANTATRSFAQARKDYIMDAYGGIVRSRSSALFNYNEPIRARTVILNVFTR